VSGETEHDVSGWTVDTLRTAVMQELANLRTLIDERDVRYQQRYDASQKALDAALLAADRAVRAALQAANEAVAKTESASDKRFELLNELRSGVATEDQLEALKAVVTALTDRINRAEGRIGGARENRTGIYAALTALGVVVTIVVVVANYLSN
jgi:predicted  nucleic acid-binding Zn-ribbon protein